MASDSDILAEVARALNGSIDVDEALNAVLTTVSDHLDLETGWVWVAEGEATFRLGASRRLPEGLRRTPEWTIGDCWCQSRFRAGGLGGGDVELIKCSRLDKLATGTDGLRYHASLALEAGGERLGIMNLASRDWRELTPDELHLLRAVSDMLSVALGRAKLYERSAELGALEERTRLSREIHDGVAQTLTALVLRLEALAAQSDDSPDPSPDLSSAIDLAQTALRDTREAVMELRSSPFGDRLAHGLELVVRRARTQSELHVDLSLDIEADPPPRVTHAICRIAQEALTNVARHAAVGSCRVVVHATAQSVTLIVRDEGGTCDLDEGHGFGLIGMRERARIVGGELAIDTDATATTVRFTWSAS